MVLLQPCRACVVAGEGREQFPALLVPPERHAHGALLSSDRRNNSPVSWVSISPSVTRPFKALSEQIICEYVKYNENTRGRGLLGNKDVCSSERTAGADDAGLVYGCRKGCVESHLMAVA